MEKVIYFAQVILKKEYKLFKRQVNCTPQWTLIHQSTCPHFIIFLCLLGFQSILQPQYSFTGLAVKLHMELFYVPERRRQLRDSFPLTYPLSMWSWSIFPTILPLCPKTFKGSLLSVEENQNMLKWHSKPSSIFGKVSILPAVTELLRGQTQIPTQLDLALKPTFLIYTYRAPYMIYA